MTPSRVAAVLLVLLAALAATPAARAQEGGPPARKVNPMPAVEAVGAFSEHTYEGWLASPLGLFFDPAQREIYVADTDGRMIGIFDPKGAPLFAFGAGSSRRRSRWRWIPATTTSTCSTRSGRGCGSSATAACRSAT